MCKETHVRARRGGARPAAGNCCGESCLVALEPSHTSYRCASNDDLSLQPVAGQPRPEPRTGPFAKAQSTVMLAPISASPFMLSMAPCASLRCVYSTNAYPCKGGRALAQ